MKKELFVVAVVFVLAISSVMYIAIAAPPTTPYTPGETLDPSCSPGDANCTVTAPAVSGANSDITSLLGLTIVGIGDADPDTALEISASTTTGYLSISSAAAADGDLFIIDELGRVGIGVQSPTEGLQLADNLKLALGTGADSQLYYDGTDSFWDLRSTGTGDLMIALSGSFPSPDAGAVHIWAGDAGAVTALAGTDFIIEDDNNAILQFLSPNSNEASIRFGDENNSNVGAIVYTHTGNTLTTRIGNTDRLIQSANTFAFQEATTISTTAGDLTLTPSGQTNVTGDLDVLGIGAFGSAVNINSAQQLKSDNVFTDTSGTLYAILGLNQIEPPSTSTGTYYGVHGQSRLDTAQIVDTIIGTRGVATMNAAGTTTRLIGIDATATINNGIAAEVTNMFGVRANIVDAEDGVVTNAYAYGANMPDVDTGSITTAYGLNVFSGTKGSGSVGNAYGLFVGSITYADVNYGLFLNEGDLAIDADGDGSAGGTSGGGDLFFGDGQDAAIWYDGTDLNIDPQIVGTGSLNILNGSVGIGDADPDTGLEIAASSTTGYFSISSAAAADGDLFIIDELGKVGIGTSTPTTALTINGDLSFDGSQTISTTAGDLILTAGSIVVFLKDIRTNDASGIRMGSDSDIQLRFRTTSVSADAELAGIIEGTSNHQGVTSNSLIITNVTDDGDIMMLVSDGGNSLEFLKADADIATLTLGHGMIATTIKTDSGDITLDPGGSDVILPDNDAISFGTGADSRLYYDGTDTFLDLQAVGAGGLMIALSGSFPSPDSDAVHIFDGSAGAVADTGFSQLIIESGGITQLTLLGPDASAKVINFGEPSSNTRGHIQYYGSADTPADTIGFGIADSERLRYSANTFAFQEATTISTTSGALTLAPAGDLTLSPGSISFTASTTIELASSSLTIDTAGASSTFVIDGDNGRVGIGDSTPEGNFDVLLDQNLTETGAVCTDTNNVLSDETDGTCDASSIKVKTDVVDLTYGLSDVMQLRPVLFRYKESFKPDFQITRAGFIAEEVDLVIPEVVTYDSYDENGQVDGAPDGIDYGKITALTVKAIQEINTGFTERVQSIIESFTGTMKTAGEWVFDRIVVRTAEIEKVKVEELCVGEVCIGEAELRALLEQGSVQPPQAASVPEPTPEPAPDPTPEPQPEEIPEEELEGAGLNQVSPSELKDTDEGGEEPPAEAEVEASEET